MPVKRWQLPPGQQDRERQLTEPAAEPRSSDTLLRAADTKADAQPSEDDLSAYGDEPINTHGSER